MIAKCVPGKFAQQPMILVPVNTLMREDDVRRRSCCNAPKTSLMAAYCAGK
jgi:hypothetical protein